MPAVARTSERAGVDIAIDAVITSATIKTPNVAILLIGFTLERNDHAVEKMSVEIVTVTGISKLDVRGFEIEKTDLKSAKSRRLSHSTRSAPRLKHVSESCVVVTSVGVHLTYLSPVALIGSGSNALTLVDLSSTSAQRSD